MGKKAKETYNLSASFTDAQLASIVLWRTQGKEWEEVTKLLNKKDGLNKSVEAVRHAYRNYSEFFESDSTEGQVKRLQEIARVKKLSSRHSRDNKAILDFLNTKDEILDEIRAIVKELKGRKLRVPKLVRKKKLKNMTLELMLSDLHYGKKTKTFNLEVARRRMKDLAETVQEEMARQRELYNVERLILALIGDIIESATMHGVESAKGCEFGNSRQVFEAIKSLFYDLILPLAKTGVQIDVPCVTGNHDRTEADRTFQNPGEENVTWIIYNTLEMMCRELGLKNVRFHVADGPYQLLEIYGNKVLYEHGDNSKACTRNALEKLLNDRQAQLKQIIDFFRVGHYHEYTVFGKGKIIVNESLPGPDSYSDVNGYCSFPGQTLNYYVETSSRPTCFYKSFPIYLK